MAAFRITSGIAAAGWMQGLGDTLRASGKASVLMLAPEIGKPLTRIRILKTVAHLDVRVHTSTRCTRGTWLKLDSTNVKGYSARKWAKLAEFWAWRIDAALEADAATRWDWASDSGKDKNRCGSKANANAVNPTFWGQGRGRIVKGRPNQRDTFGFSPASGKACRTHQALETTCK